MEPLINDPLDTAGLHSSYSMDPQPCNYDDPLPPESEYHDFLVPINRDDFGIAVWLTGMVDEPSFIARHRSIHHFISINPEHVATDTLREWVHKGLIGGRQTCSN